MQAPPFLGTSIFFRPKRELQIQDDTLAKRELQIWVGI